MNVDLTADDIKEINGLVSKKLEGIVWVLKNGKDVQNKEALEKRAEAMRALLDRLGFKPDPNKRPTKF